MTFEEWSERAKQETSSLPMLELEDVALEHLRVELREFLFRLPEPPVYRRRDDPVKKVAAERLEEAVKLRARLHQLTAFPESIGLTRLLEAHAQCLSLLAMGQIEAADGAWHEALKLEHGVVSERRLWSRSDEKVAPVFSGGQSRYDPKPESTVRVKLMCPMVSCRSVEEYSLGHGVPSHVVRCLKCQSPFTAWLGTVRSVDTQVLKPTLRRYRFRLDALGGGANRIEFESRGEGELSAARGDLVAFLYAPARHLRGVLNLSSSRVLWVDPGGACFLVSAVYGEEAPQLEAFRRFRDHTLRASFPGALAVDTYYAVGPMLARGLRSIPGGRLAARAVFDRVHARLVRSQW